MAGSMCVQLGAMIDGRCALLAQGSCQRRSSLWHASKRLLSHSSMAIHEAHAGAAPHAAVPALRYALQRAHAHTSSSLVALLLRSAAEPVPGQGRVVARMQAGVKMLQLHTYLAERGYECSFAPGAAHAAACPCVRPNGFHPAQPVAHDGSACAML